MGGNNQQGKGVRWEGTAVNEIDGRQAAGGETEGERTDDDLSSSSSGGTRGMKRSEGMGRERRKKERDG